MPNYISLDCYLWRWLSFKYINRFRWKDSNLILNIWYIWYMWLIKSIHLPFKYIDFILSLYNFVLYYSSLYIFILFAFQLIPLFFQPININFNKYFLLFIFIYVLNNNKPISNFHKLIPHMYFNIIHLICLCRV